MPKIFQRRHSRWYEQVLFSSVFQFLLGFAVVVILPAWFRWSEDFLYFYHSQTAWNSTFANAAAFLVFFIAVRYLRNFPGAQSLGYIFPTLIFVWLLAVAVMFFFRLEYARQALVASFFVANVWVLIGYFVRRKYRVLKLAVVPIGKRLSSSNSVRVNVTLLQTPSLDERRYDAIVADLHAVDLEPEWEKFLARCALARIPVFHVKQIEESLTGKVQIEHLSENEIGSLLPSQVYSRVKYLIDVLSVFILLPFLLPIMFISAILIKVDSKGPALFVQERIGYRGKVFKVIKFRSMYCNIKGKGFTEGDNDPRITRIGKVIRKFRIDELPQIFNVIKGDMSFIGPRPESKQLSDWYEKDVPFFAYRHIVKPGISGWAQVNQGYAAEVDGMTEKLQYDFYYIKHFSLWLDILIFFKTIRTVFTGFGAR